MQQSIFGCGCCVEERTVDESSKPITPAKATDKGREDQAHEQHNFEIVAVLPAHHRVLVQV